MVVSLITVTARGRFDQRLVEAEGRIVGPSLDQMGAVARDGDRLDALLRLGGQDGNDEQQGGKTQRQSHEASDVKF